MSTFRVRASSLGEVAAQLQGVIAVFDGQVSALSAKVAAVSGATWQGDDQEAFSEKWASWQQTSEMVRLSLTALAAQLVAGEGAYTTTESSIQSGFVQRRQANNVVVDAVEDVDEAVDTGLERARTGEQREQGVAAFAGAPMRTGQGAARGDASRPTREGDGDE
jgi:WXG100 family type VII secretion target